MVLLNERYFVNVICNHSILQSYPAIPVINGKKRRLFGIQMRCREHHSVGWLHFCWQSIKYAASGSPILQDEEESNPLALLQPMLVFSQVWRRVTKHPFSATAGGGADRGCLKFSPRWECFTGDRRATEGSWTSVCNISSILIKKILRKILLLPVTFL